jgi:hypothetical protein
VGQLIEMPHPKFTRKVFALGHQNVILSTCNRCDRKRLVSLNDGSLSDWEQNHRCAILDVGPVTARRDVV